MATIARRTRWGVALALGAAALAPSVAGAAPRPIVVPCDGADGGVAGLRAAITRLNDEGGGEIRLERECTYAVDSVDNRTRSGANGLPVVRADIVVTTERDFEIINVSVGEDEGPPRIVKRGRAPFRLFEVARGARLSITHVELEGGTAPTGGAIRNNGEQLALSYVSISGSTATGPAAQGGAVWSASPVRLSYSAVTRTNAVGRTAAGGAIWSGGGVTLRYSSVVGAVARARDGDALGGGIYSRGRVDLAYSHVTGNTASSAHRRALGGGVFGPTGVALSYSEVTRNVAAGRPAEGGGVYSPGVGVDTRYSSVEGNRPDNCRC